VAGLGRRVVVVAGSVVVGRWVVVVGARVTSEVTIEVTVTVRIGCSSWPALATNAPSRNPTTPSTQPWRHHGGLPFGGCPGGAPQPPGGSCPQPPVGGIGSVGRSISPPGFMLPECAYSSIERPRPRPVTRASYGPPGGTPTKRNEGGPPDGSTAQRMGLEALEPATERL
jgi:hypothetical protein